jgi:hypothetical protein
MVIFTISLPDNNMLTCLSFSAADFSVTFKPGLAVLKMSWGNKICRHYFIYSVLKHYFSFLVACLPFLVHAFSQKEYSSAICAPHWGAFILPARLRSSIAELPLSGRFCRMGGLIVACFDLPFDTCVFPVAFASISAAILWACAAAI